MTVLKPDHKQNIESFIAIKGVYDEYADILHKIFLKAVKILAPNSIVQTRSKGISSFAEKIIRKNKYKDPLSEITDLCGARIITHTQKQIDAIAGFIKDNFLIDAANSVDVSERLSIKEFGYRSVHFVISPIKDSILGINIPKHIRTKKAEVQVRTILQHTWADLLHDRLYKTALNIPQEWIRESARLAALLENADENITRITSLIDSYTANFGNRMDKVSLKREIDTLVTIYNNEPNKSQRAAIALKIARLAKFLGDWYFSIKYLRPNINGNREIAQELMLELGFAYCHLGKSLDDLTFFGKGYALLKKVLSITATDKKLYLLSLTYLALTGRDFVPDKEIKKYINEAYSLNHNSPYLLARVLEYNSGYSQSLPLYRDKILHAISKCRTDIELGIESLEAFFTIGRLSLIAGDHNSSYYYYLKAFQLCLGGKLAVHKELIEAEYYSLGRINKVAPFRKEINIIRSITAIVLFLLYKDIRKLRNHKTHNSIKIAKDYSIIKFAGNLNELSKKDSAEYYGFVQDSLNSFYGRMDKGKSDGAEKLLFNFDFSTAIKTKSDISKFPHKRTAPPVPISEQKIVDFWVELVAAGVLPNNVKIVGIGGDNINLFEYLIALAFGAQVGLLTNSGGSADIIYSDPNWRTLENLYPLPDEYESLWAFIYYNSGTILSDRQIEITARAIHENYIKKQESRIKKEPSLEPWDKLSESLKKSNINQASSIIELLSTAGFEVRSKGCGKKPIYKFSKKQIITLAKLEHGRFVVDRLMSGWKYGPVKNIETKTTPYLVKWDNLTDNIKQLDIDVILNFPQLLSNAGLEIYKREGGTKK